MQKNNTKWITRHKKNQIGAYLLLLLLTLTILMVHTLLGQSSRLFNPINRTDLYKIIMMNHSDFRLVKAIIEVESNWMPNAVSSKGAIGLMQVLPQSGKVYAGFSRHELFCPEKNIIAGTTILKHYQKISPNLQSALDKYSGGAAGYYEKVMRRM